MFQCLVFIENEANEGCQGEGRPTAFEGGNGGKQISYTWSFKAWFKAWLGMASSMARYGSLNDQAHHEEHMGSSPFRSPCGQPKEGLI